MWVFVSGFCFVFFVNLIENSFVEVLSIILLVPSKFDIFKVFFMLLYT